MIIEKHTCICCKSENIRKNGPDSFNGKQKYHCLNCNRYGTLNAEPKHSFVRKKEILDAYFERPSMRGIERIFKVSRQTLATWLIELGKKEELKDLKASLNDVPYNDTLELDELCSFVQKKKNKKWLWTAISRSNRKIVAFYIGDHSEKSCLELWLRVPTWLKNGLTFSDFWKPYEKIITSLKHVSVGKNAGETNHMERWNNTLRQWLGKYTRKTLSFSKSEQFHELVTRLFIIKYNLSKSVPI